MIVSSTCIKIYQNISFFQRGEKIVKVKTLQN